MLSRSVKLSALIALAVLTLSLPAPAAPIIKSGGSGLHIDKYLPDDVDGVLVINVKQMMESPAYKAGFQKQIEELLARADVKPFLKDAGFDPLKDVEHIVMCMGRSCFREDLTADAESGPLFLFLGKFDVAKMKEKMASIAKEHPTAFTPIDGPAGEKIYRVSPRGGPYAAPLDAKTVAVGSMKTQVLDALNKASGKKTTKFVHKEVAMQLKKLKTDVSIQGFALEHMVINSTYESQDNGMGKRVLKAKYVTLADKGFAEASLGINVKDDASGSSVWQIKDKTKAPKFVEEFKAGLEEGRKALREQAARMPRFASMARFLDALSVKSTASTFTIEGRADADTVRSLFMSIFMPFE